MSAKKPPKIVTIPAPIWMVSFGDTIALMLAFFVMLFALSSLESSQVARLISSISSQDVDVVVGTPTPNSNLSIENINLYPGEESDYILELIQLKVNESSSLEEIEITTSNDEVIILLPNSIFVDDLEANISPKGADMLNELGLILSTISNSIAIESYSPPEFIPPDGKVKFNNRWEIRLLRATKVGQEMKKNGLLASNRVMGWAHPPLDPADIETNNKEVIAPLPDDTRISLRVNSSASGQ